MSTPNQYNVGDIGGGGYTSQIVKAPSSKAARAFGRKVYKSQIKHGKKLFVSKLKG